MKTFSHVDTSTSKITFLLIDMDKLKVRVKNKCHKENYRPMSILSEFSKIHGKFLTDQLYGFLIKILSTNQCAFQKITVPKNTFEL